MSINIEQVTERRTGEKFPNIVIPTPNDTLVVVVPTLEKGDMQLITEFNGKRKVLANISPSALNVDKLLRTVGKLQYKLSTDLQIEIEDISTYLSCV